MANLPWETTRDDLHRLFGRHGQVHQTTIVIDRRTGRSKGFGFVEMASPAAEHAVEALHGSVLGTRTLTVRAARPKRRRRA